MFCNENGEAASQLHPSPRYPIELTSRRRPTLQPSGRDHDQSDNFQIFLVHDLRQHGAFRERRDQARLYRRWQMELKNDRVD